MKTRYRNTDLDLISTVPLDGLNQKLEAAGMMVLGTHQNGDGDWTTVLGIIGEEDDCFWVDVETTIVAMLNILESLPEQERRAFEQCKLREFNAAYDLGDAPVGFNQGLSVDTISRMAALKTSLRITLYPGDG
ncbi:hypothetical protein Q5Y75_09550 [Ruegeria sp. 2205SS24-7]|uniref:hypothetical protein n=1 Tax=Ruegeria discodermiae TaxID=3064389 RepID=UPI002741D37F|nr:hypothetical protein [Ruegeria sp. 2205SS24-7]MDP5217460.1 hypothetical protein [Ruegeria sp. 2205SS24-7]